MRNRLAVGQQQRAAFPRKSEWLSAFRAPTSGDSYLTNQHAVPYALGGALRWALASLPPVQQLLRFLVADHRPYVTAVVAWLLFCSRQSYLAVAEQATMRVILAGIGFPF